MYDFSIDETRSLDLEDEEKPNAMPALDFQGENLHEISNILTDQTANEPVTEPATSAVTEVIEIDNDCEMFITGTFPQPQKANVDMLIKRTYDDISIDKPFTETVRNSMKYGITSSIE